MSENISPWVPWARESRQREWVVLTAVDSSLYTMRLRGMRYLFTGTCDSRKKNARGM
jgi:hypothetical protein